MNSESIRVVQLSDTHFLAPGDSPEGGFAYDTGAAFDAVFDHHLVGHAETTTDLVVVTGDVADHGRAEQYRPAAAAFASFDAPVNVCPGNHDQDVAFSAGIGRASVGTSRVMEFGSWCFLFVDSNRGAMVADTHGRLVDPPDYDDRLHRNGALGDREAAWIADMSAATEADHVFIWLHHPPGPPVGLSYDDGYAAEWSALLPQLSKVRGLGAGHTHVPDEYLFDEVPVFVSPSLKNNFDLAAATMLPPGYRTYDFQPDGSIHAAVNLVDDDRWPRHPIGRSVVALLRGELTWDEFHEIVNRKKP